MWLNDGILYCDDTMVISFELLKNELNKIYEF